MLSRRATAILAGALAGGGAFLLLAWRVHEQHCQRWATARPGEPCVEPGDGLVLLPLFAAIGAVAVWIIYDWLRDRHRSGAAT